MAIRTYKWRIKCGELGVYYSNDPKAERLPTKGVFMVQAIAAEWSQSERPEKNVIFPDIPIIVEAIE